MKSSSKDNNEINFDKKDFWILPSSDLGNITYVLSSANNFIYILTNSSNFYVLDKEKKKANSHMLIPSLSKQETKFQTTENKSQIWCDKKGNHVVIKQDKRVFYYNPSFRNKDGFVLQEINLEYKDQYLEPYSFAFNDEESTSLDTGDILFSDFFSDIYRIRIRADQNKKEIKTSFDLVFSLQPKNYDEDDYDYDKDNFGFPKMNFLQLEKNERILDMKILITKSKSIEKDILILAATKNMLFQFYGKGTSYKDIFKNYSLDNGDILKAFKKFSNNSEEKEFSKLRIQLLSSYSLGSETTSEQKELYFGWMTAGGYCLGNLGDVSNNKPALPQKDFSVFSYVKPKKEGVIQISPRPIAVCHSVLHVFFLYNDCLIVVNKITNMVVYIDYFALIFMDMYFDETLNSMILYTEKNIFKIELDKEDRNIWRNYIEEGNYDFAIKYLPNEEKKIKPKLHKLKAEEFFKKEEYDLAALEYALSDENFENVCIKFILVNQLTSLLKYLDIIKNVILSEQDKKDTAKNYIRKYLIYTWIVEILIETGGTTIDKKGTKYDLQKFIEELRYGYLDKYVDKKILYNMLQNFGKEKEFVDYAMIKGDYELIVQNLLSHLKYEEVLNNLDKFISNVNGDFDEKNIPKLIKIFYEYSGIFMKELPLKTISILENDVVSENHENEIIKIITGSDFKEQISNSKNYEALLNYMRKLIQKNKLKEKEKLENNDNNKTNDNENIEISNIKNLHNLYILFLSLSSKPEYQEEIINYLKEDINSIKNKNSCQTVYIDLNFAYKILQNNYKALALVYCLMGRYNESIKIALEKDQKETAIFIAQNIENDKIKKDIWLRIFKFYKTNNFANAKNILESSQGVLKIEDILPFMMEDVKLEELKNDLEACINFYEEGVSQLRQEINDYNKSTENILNDMLKIQKKSTCLNYTQVKCEKCQKDITGSKFFLFPCGHIFDTNCLVKILIEYDNKNIGDKKFKEKVNNIKSLSEKILRLRHKKTKIKNEQKQNQSTFKVFFNFINKDQREEFSKEEEEELRKTSNELFSLLKEECVLCGQEMINSTQIKLGEDENKKWADLI